LPRSIVAADFDADGDQDLAVGNILSDDITILRNNGSGYLAEAPSSPEVVANAVAMVTADFDGDTDPDLASADQGGDAARILLSR
jgi:FG-GAP-like repeat